MYHNCIVCLLVFIYINMHIYIRAYVKETDAKFEREEKARVDEVAKRFKRAAADGPASQTTMMIKMAAEKSTEDTFERLRLAENSLNRQLKATEEGECIALYFYSLYLLYMCLYSIAYNM